MRTSSLISLLTLVSLASGYDDASRILPRGSTEQQGAEQLVLTSEGCTVSHMARYDKARGRKPIFFSTSSLDDFEQPSIEPLNSTAGEQWEFDGISEDGSQALVFGFYRDPNYSFFGSGNLRMYAEFAFANGSRYAVVEYAEESTVERCPDGGTFGTWRGDGWVYTFEISADMSRTKIVMDNPEAKATVLMTSVAPPRYANNEIWPSEEGSSLTVPHFYWVEPVPVAELSVNAVIENEAIAWTGMGGHERLWGAFNWFTCLAGMTAVRLHAGPYALSLVEFGSARQKGLLVPSLLLAESGIKTFGSRRTEPSGTEDYFQICKLYDGNGTTTEALADKVTGVELVLHSPSRQKQWRFVVTHKIVGFEYILGEGVGGTAYSGTAEGGLVGAAQWKGPAFTEFLKFPQKSLIFSDNFVQ
ncbi:hypothetical protein DL768_010762 [Monosporascus sp. mg162]|nr:hypothetical protein DL768_010762 [Monosporascus sp. mg162]